jgi:predicted Zn finger-like uncharacterized protein
MPIRVTCPECGASYPVNDELGGKKVRCRKCEATVPVPKGKKADVEEIEIVEDDEGVQEKVPAAKKKAAAVAGGKPARRRDEDYDDEDDDRPRGKKGKKGQKAKPRSAGATIAIVTVLLVVIIGGVGTALYFAFKGDGTTKVADNSKDRIPTGPPQGMGAGAGPGRGGPPVGGGGGPPVGGGGATVNPPPVNTGKEPEKPSKAPETTQPTLLAGNQAAGSEVYKRLLKSVCMIQTLIDARTGQGAIGSGQLIDRENRLVLTNYHVVHGLQDFVVLFPIYENGNMVAEKDRYRSIATRTAIKGKVLAHDKSHDCALIQINEVPPEVDAIPFAKDRPKSGDHLHSVGNAGVSGSVFVYTPGVVRQVYRKSYVTGNGHDLSFQITSTIIEATSPTNPGDSGGPCANDRAELVGICQGGLVGAEAQMAYFIERSELEGFVEEVFRTAPDLKGKQWARSTLPPLVPNDENLRNLPTYVKMIESPDDNARVQGIQGLKSLGPDAHPALPFLIKALGDKNPLVVRTASDCLRMIGQIVPTDMEYLLPVLETATSPPDAKAFVLEQLAVLGPVPEAESAKDEILKLSADTNAKVRLRAMIALGKLTPLVGDKKALDALDKGLKDGDRKVRGAAAIAITTGTSMKNDVAKLKDLLKSKEPEVSAPAAQALGLLGERAKSVSPDLVTTIQGSDDRNVRRNCYLALKSVKADAQVFLPVLRPGIQDGDVDVKRAALTATGAAGASAKDLLPLILDTLSDSDVRHAALGALRDLGPSAASGAPQVATLLTTDRNMRSETLAALEGMKPTGNVATLVVPKVIDVFADEKPDSAVFNKAADLLGHAIGRPAVLPLGDALSRPSASVKLGAAKALGAMPSEAKAVVFKIQAAFNAETDTKVKDALLETLKRVAAAPPPKA